MQYHDSVRWTVLDKVGGYLTEIRVIWGVDGERELIVKTYLRVRWLACRTLLL